MRNAIWVVVGAALAVGAWWVWRPGGTVATVADWLRHDGCEVKVESVHLPMPRDFAAPERRFTDAAKEAKFVECEGLGGAIFYYRFASVGDRLRAAAANPRFYRSSTSCAKGTEALYDNLIFSQTRTAAYCRRLRFQIERPLPRWQH